MYLSELRLENFRNYQNLSMSFSPYVNVIIGTNAQGKTNLIESIYILSMSRSYRTNNSRELIAFHKSKSKINGIVNYRNYSLNMEISLNRKGKSAKINNFDKARLSEYIGQLNVVLFSPDDLLIIKGAPILRRKFVDVSLGQISNIYLYNLSQYYNILKQRNHYLKMLQSKKAHDILYLNILSEQLAKLGSRIIVQRLNFLEEIESFSNIIYRTISQKQRKLSFHYETNIKKIDKDNKNIFNQLKFIYKQNQNKEIIKGVTLYGPHRDDIKFLLDGENVQLFGSQGQQRSLILSIKLAEIDLIKHKTGEYPILLLDDVLSELDSNRQHQLLELIKHKVQTFLTTPLMKSKSIFSLEHSKIFNVINGHIYIKNNNNLI